MTSVGTKLSLIVGKYCQLPATLTSFCEYTVKILAAWLSLQFAIFNDKIIYFFLWKFNGAFYDFRVPSKVLQNKFENFTALLKITSGMDPSIIMSNCTMIYKAI